MAWPVSGAHADHQQEDQPQTPGVRGLSGVLVDGDCSLLMVGMEKKGVGSANKIGQELELKGT